jgi:hypothetical protein
VTVNSTTAYCFLVILIANLELEGTVGGYYPSV